MNLIGIQRHLQLISYDVRKLATSIENFGHRQTALNLRTTLRELSEICTLVPESPKTALTKLQGFIGNLEGLNPSVAKVFGGRPPLRLHLTDLKSICEELRRELTLEGETI